MEIQKISCASCGAPISIPSNIDSFNCGFCGTGLVVNRGDGYVALQIAEDMKKTIQEVGEQTNSSIRESSEATQLELKKIQLQQELSSIQLQASVIQDEIRNLEQGKKNRKKKKQLKELYNQKNKLAAQAQSIRNSPIAQGSSVVNAATNVQKTSKKESPTKSGCLVGFLVFMLVGVCLTMIATPLDNAIFGINLQDATNETGPFASVAAFTGLVAGIAAFYFRTNPESKLWKKIKQTFSIKTTD
jgi:hypothetical protein